MISWLNRYKPGVQANFSTHSLFSLSLHFFPYSSVCVSLSPAYTHTLKPAHTISLKSPKLSGIYYAAAEEFQSACSWSSLCVELTQLPGFCCVLRMKEPCFLSQRPRCVLSYGLLSAHSTFATYSFSTCMSGLCVYMCISVCICMWNVQYLGKKNNNNNVIYAHTCVCKQSPILIWY